MLCNLSVRCSVIEHIGYKRQTGHTDKAEFYTELSENNSVVIQIRNTIVRKIKDLLLAS